MSNVSLGRPQLDNDRRRYLVTLNMNVAGAGKVQGTLAGYFGRDSVVQVCFYAKAEDWPLMAPTGQQIIDSFHFDPAEAYVVETAAANTSSSSSISSPKNSIWSGIGGQVLSSGGAAALLGVVGFFISRFVKSKDA